MIKPMPWYLRLMFRGYWVTISPNIYHPIGVDPMRWPAIVYHEQVHLWQQRNMGLWKWLWRYCTNRDFRYSEEIQACRAELTYVYGEADRRQSAMDNAFALSNGYRGLDLRTAAKSYEQAYTAITEGIL